MHYPDNIGPQNPNPLTTSPYVDQPPPPTAGDAIVYSNDIVGVFDNPSRYLQPENHKAIKGGLLQAGGIVLVAAGVAGMAYGEYKFHQKTGVWIDFWREHLSSLSRSDKVELSAIVLSSLAATGVGAKLWEIGE